ncbi:MAG: undecaprenyl/decaprenyl-phosphate alpha-N-acetylglucosaminyl 1-phosphate transferase [Pedobacter sp.]|nr:MAG: undecaprenyl/decaprenyl-phosphate alpha-N-acetylglucosaminyl 1-phosphate transferase [Pedobacter sp.]
MDFIDGNILYYLAIVGLSFLLSTSAIPSIIHIALKYRLFDDADSHRKLHRAQISRLGGVAIFCAFTITILLFATTVDYQAANFLITSCIILFGLGLKDDLYGVNPSTKFMLQMVVAIILVVLGDFRLSSLYGVLFLWEVNFFFGGIFSIVLIIFVNNAFNLIDGMDGLAGTIGVITTLSFGLFFAIGNELPYAFIAFAMAGAIGGFLVFNYSPAKIFMGDTGALLIGLVSVILAIKFIELNKIGQIPNPNFYSAPAIAVAVLLVPVFDSLRVFFIRILHKKSPFTGDRNHIHHRLQQLGFSTKKILVALTVFNVGMIFFAVTLQNLGNFVLISLLISICVVFNSIITYKLGKKNDANYRLSDVFTKDTFPRGRSEASL